MHDAYFFYFSSCKFSSGAKMKETFLQTGSFEEVQATVKQIRSRSVKDQDTEKPVTKLMLKETWKWDEWGPQFHDVMHEAILMYVFVKCVIFTLSPKTC